MHCYLISVNWLASHDSGWICDCLGLKSWILAKLKRNCCSFEGFVFASADVIASEWWKLQAELDGASGKTYCFVVDD